MSLRVRKIIAVLCGLVLTAGIICCIYVPDDTMLAMVAILAILYVAYLVKLYQYCKNNPEKASSPLKKKQKP